MAAWLPPETPHILRLLAERNARRARRLHESLARSPGGPEPWRAEALRALDAVLAGTRGARRLEFLTAPDLRGWLNTTEEAVRLADTTASDAVLFARAARGPYLALLVPRGRIDRGFRRRAVRLGRRLVDRALLRLAPTLCFLTPGGERFGPFPLDLAEDGEEARLAGEIHLTHPAPATLTLQPGARLELFHEGIRVIQSGRGIVWTPRACLHGTDIVLARRAVSTRLGLVPGPAVRGLASRLDEALSMVRASWPEAYREVAAHTRVVVPLVEAGTVSFSMAGRPGVSYINVWDKRPVDLADDLVHEAAHHRLHAMEELGALDRDDGEPRYNSPWRREVRPLRGILHASYTFCWRAELLSRLLRAPALGPLARLPRAWMRRQIESEAAALRRSLSDLADSDHLGLLTPAGSALRLALARRVRGLRVPTGALSRKN